jgi:hypothetical protein
MMIIHDPGSDSRTTPNDYVRRGNIECHTAWPILKLRNDAAVHRCTPGTLCKVHSLSRVTVVQYNTKGQWLEWRVALVAKSPCLSMPICPLGRLNPIQLSGRRLFPGSGDGPVDPVRVQGTRANGKR